MSAGENGAISRRETMRGPCYPDYPNMSKAFVVHVRSEDGRTCERCGWGWPQDGSREDER